MCQQTLQLSTSVHSLLWMFYIRFNAIVLREMRVIVMTLLMGDKLASGFIKIVAWQKALETGLIRFILLERALCVTSKSSDWGDGGRLRVCCWPINPISNFSTRLAAPVAHPPPKVSSPDRGHRQTAPTPSPQLEQAARGLWAPLPAVSRTRCSPSSYDC